jgi:hypothetical protein
VAIIKWSAKIKSFTGRTQMKRITVAIALVVTLVLVGTFGWRNAKVHAMNIQVNIKDIPEEGIRILAPSDPSFDKKVESFLKGPSGLVDRIKPFSVIVENTGQLAIVGSRLTWEIVKSDGTVYRHQVGSANPQVFLGGDKIIQTAQGAAIPPHSKRFVSLVGSAAEGEQVDLNTIELTFRGSQSELQEFNQELLQGNREEAFNKSSIAKTMAEATNVTVSIDGIFFEDGTFVGENKTGLFEEVKAYVDAEYDMVTEISVAQKQGETPDSIVAQVTDFLMAHSRTEGESPLINKHGAQIERSQKLTALASMKSSTDAYQKYKTMYARTFLKKKERLGTREAIREALNLLNKPRIELRKK